MSLNVFIYIYACINIMELDAISLCKHKKQEREKKIFPKLMFTQDNSHTLLFFAVSCRNYLLSTRHSFSNEYICGFSTTGRAPSGPIILERKQTSLQLISPKICI